MTRLLTLVLLLSIFTSCKDNTENQKSFNILADILKAEMNKLSVPCNVSPSEIRYSNPEGIDMEKDAGILIPFEKNKITVEGHLINFEVNKTSKDGYQFRYWADITSVTDSTTIITRDQGTIWMYCDDYKKWNEKQEKKPEFKGPRMITVE